MNQNKYISLVLCLILMSCSPSTDNNDNSSITSSKLTTGIDETMDSVLDQNIKTIHILVALCDNKYQGIVPVPEKIGNGQDPYNNLYWGTAYGIRTYFKSSNDWKFINTIKSSSSILERIIFKHKIENYYLVADAYDGKYIKETTRTFLMSSSGMKKDTVHINNKVIGINGYADLIAYIGHDGLMDFRLNEDYINKDGRIRDVIILACYSRRYFSDYLIDAKVNPLVWTTGLMAPEAYTIHDALTGYINRETNTQIWTRAAKAYSKYQKCGLKAAKNLLVTGWEK